MSEMSESKRVLYMVCSNDDLTPLYQQLASTIGHSKYVADYSSPVSWNAMQPRDSGIDLFMPITNVCPPGITTMIDLGISVSAYDEVYGKRRHPYILPPSAATPLALFLIVRSSTGKKTPLRQANAPGLIDQGYRGHLMAAVDNISHEPFRAEEGARYFQLMACDGIPFDEVQLVDAPRSW
jgi:hypothetical protein